MANDKNQIQHPVSGTQCDQIVKVDWTGPRQCSRKRANGDTLCKQHRASAERTGYEPARIVGGDHGD